MKKLIVSVFFILLTITFLRSLYGAPPLSLSSFLEMLSGIEFNFTKTIQSLSLVEFPRYDSSLPWFAGPIDYILNIIEFFGDLVVEGVGLIIDFVDFLRSVVLFVLNLLGIAEV